MWNKSKEITIGKRIKNQKNTGWSNWSTLTHDWVRTFYEKGD